MTAKLVPAYKAEGVTLYQSDCLDALCTLDDASVDAVVTDPPSGISFMGRSWDTDHGGRDQWVAWHAERLAECLRVAKPGARLLCWALPRTSHWTGMAVEDAGWRIEDRVSHLFGTGFPKHASKLKPACEDWWLAIKPDKKATPLNIDACRIGESKRTPGSLSNVTGLSGYGERSGRKGQSLTDGGHDSSLGRWPANVVISHSPDCQCVGIRRVKTGIAYEPSSKEMKRTIFGNTNTLGRECGYADADGGETIEAWECVEGCPVAELDRQSGTTRSSGGVNGGTLGERIYGAFRNDIAHANTGGLGDSGGASRFFYVAKADREDRGLDNTHPTVKNTDLMCWLCRLITPPDGIVLDPFSGSFSTGVACVLEGFRFVGIERESEYVEIGIRRIKNALLDVERPHRAKPSVRAEDKPMPLFAGAAS